MRIKVREIAIFSMLAALMFASKILMEFLPNIHLLGVFTMAITIVYRAKALYPIYAYVFVNGLYAGFNVWWVPYLYIWTILWGVTMLLPKRMPPRLAPIVYAVVCALHGFLYGILYSPAQAIFFGYDFKTALAWVIAGIPFDLIHGFSNLCCGFLIIPIVRAIRTADRSAT